MPLKIKVKYTSKAKPTICSHLNVSHPSPSDTIQMNSVRHVSIVDRDVALTFRVTDSPKKLKPLVSNVLAILSSRRQCFFLTQC